MSLLTRTLRENIVKCPVFPQVRLHVSHGETEQPAVLADPRRQTDSVCFSASPKIYRFDREGMVSATCITDSGALGTNRRKKSASPMRRFDGMA